MFNGEKVESWVMRVDQYFEMGNFSETQKMHAMGVCLDSDVVSWFLWEKDRRPFLSWEMMK